jgi:glycosyltransferase involved in cell wall biosynthesis
VKINPKISVILPVFNREHLIERAIRSVLNQSYTNLELLVIDDASTDRTPKKIFEIMDDRLKYFRNNANFGPSKSRNRGIELSSGELIAFQDSDDEWYPDRLEKQINTLCNSSEDTAAVYCAMEFIDFNTGKKIGEFVYNADFRKTFTKGTHLVCPANVTVLIKKNILEEVGYFDERLFAEEDIELAIRVSKKYRYEYIPESLVKITRNHDQLMANAKNYILAEEIIYEKHKDYLSKKILFGVCKQIANYYILTDNYGLAKAWLKKSFKHQFDIKTLAQLSGLTFTPFLIKYFYNKKYKGEIPILSGLISASEH